jgi:hypothetical protein
MILLIALSIILVAVWFNFCLEYIGDKVVFKPYGFAVVFSAFVFPIALIVQIGVWLCQ